MTTMKEAMGKKRKQSPQYDFLWRVELPDIGGNSQEINHRIETFDSPFFEIETKKVTSKSTFWYAASNNDIGNISMTVHDMEDGATIKYFVDWYNLIINPDGTYNHPVEYKKPVKLFRLSVRQGDLYSYLYKEYFVTEIQTLSNTYDGNDFTKYNITLAGDSVEYKFVGNVADTTEEDIMNEQWARNEPDLQSGGLNRVGGIA